MPNHAPPELDQAVAGASTTSSYVLQLIHDKPLVVAVGTLAATILARITLSWQDHAIGIGMICALVVIDWWTRLRALRKTKQPVTSEVMRRKGFSKLRDYLILYIAGSLTIPLMGDHTGYNTVLFAIASWELWSVGENLYDGGSLPFDIRHMTIAEVLHMWFHGRHKD